MNLNLRVINYRRYYPHTNAYKITDFSLFKKENNHTNTKKKKKKNSSLDVFLCQRVQKFTRNDSIMHWQ